MHRSLLPFCTAPFRRTALALMLLVGLCAAFPEDTGLASQIEGSDGNAIDHEPSVSCSGDGSPAIVLLGGYGGGISDWRMVQPELARDNLVCSYDRRSSQIEGTEGRPATAAVATEELRRLLEMVQVESPVVLVGFSIGGLLARHFQSEYPELVAGIVLIDPTPPEWPALRIGGASVRSRQDLVVTLSGMNDREPERIDILEVGNAVIAASVPSSPVVMLTAGVRIGSPGLYGDIQNALLNRLQNDQERELSAVRFVAPLCSHQLPTECDGEVTSAVRLMLTMVAKETARSNGLVRLPFEVALLSRRDRIVHQLKVRQIHA